MCFLGWRDRATGEAKHVAAVETKESVDSEMKKWCSTLREVQACGMCCNMWIGREEILEQDAGQDVALRGLNQGYLKLQSVQYSRLASDKMRRAATVGVFTQVLNFVPWQSENCVSIRYTMQASQADADAAHRSRQRLEEQMAVANGTARDHKEVAETAILHSTPSDYVPGRLPILC
eukprot:1092246-Amphidinium_carterae.1